MKLHCISILVCLGFGSFFQLARAEDSSIMVDFDGQRFGCFPVVNVLYIAEEITSELRTGNWWEVKARVFVARDSKGRTLRRQPTEDMFVNGATHPNYAIMTINDPAAHTFTKWVEGVEDERSITVGDSPSCAPRRPEEAHETLIGTGPGAMVAYDKEWLLSHTTHFPMYTDIHSEPSRGANSGGANRWKGCVRRWSFPVTPVSRTKSGGATAGTHRSFSWCSSTHAHHGRGRRRRSS